MSSRSSGSVYSHSSKKSVIDKEKEKTNHSKSKIPNDYEKLLEAFTIEQAPGPRIHPSITERWQQICTRGQDKETKETLIKKYPCPENSVLFKSPELNADIRSGISKGTLNKDSFQVLKQIQLTAALSAISKVLSEIMAD